MRCRFQRRHLKKFVVVFFTASVIAVLYTNVYTSLALRSGSESTTSLTRPYVTANGLLLEFTSSIKQQVHSALNSTKDESESIIATPPRKFGIPSKQQPAHTVVNSTNTRSETNIIIPEPHPSICLDKQILNTSMITKLGSYPQTKGFLTIGIASIFRPQGDNYLVKTIQGLIDNTSDEERREIFIVIFLADFNGATKSTALTEIFSRFEKNINQGFIRVIFAPKEFYPPLSNVKKKFGDNPKRIFWRSNQNIDFTFLMCYCHGLSQYYLHLEDDVLPAPSFYPKLRDFISSVKKPWPILDASYMGHVAKVYHGNDLENLATYFYLMYDEMPVDWLIIFWRRIKSEGPFDQGFIFPPASLFQHVGSHSSFAENKGRDTNKSREQYFDQYDIKYKGLNPSAIVSSQMTSNLGHPQDAYNKGYGYFWTKEVKQGDFILVEFTSAVTVRKVVVDTGSYIAPKDQLQSAVLQASFKTEGQTSDSPKCKDFQTIGEFKKGKAEVTFDGAGKNTTCLQVLVTSPQPTWVFFREIDVWLA
ncbi:alpha-1,6-mannosyl-glycoprotein 4-beta-N-acetylglucosaminyltransferase-like isoform X1 [Oculina patagonica]